MLSIARLQRRLFSVGTPTATGVLHIAGRRGSQGQPLKLSRPRRNLSRGAVSYRARRLTRRTAGRAAGFRAQRRFGAASLSIVGAPRRLGTSGGHACTTTVINNAGSYSLQFLSSSKGEDDIWVARPGGGVTPGDFMSWESQAGVLQGCSNQAVWGVVGGSGTVTLSTTYPWIAPFGNTCVSTSPQVRCQPAVNEQGNATWTTLPK